MTTTELTTKYNNDSTGLFKAGQNRGIGSDKMRSLVTDIVATFLDQLSIMSSVIASGTNTYTGSLPLVMLSYTNYMKVYVKIQNTSTGASTLNLSAVGAKKIFITPSVQASAGDLIANQWYLFSYDAALDAAAGGWIAIGLGPPKVIQLAASDETTALTTGTAKITFRMPYAMMLTAVRASLSTAQTSGSTFTVDINKGGSTILSTKLTIDNTEKTSTTAATPAVISDSSLADDAEITIDIDTVGDGTAAGLKISLIGI